jgi:hypothetical protein
MIFFKKKKGNFSQIYTLKNHNLFFWCCIIGYHPKRDLAWNDDKFLELV